jgi:hypothetical protein
MKSRLIFIGDLSGLSLFLSRGVSAYGREVVFYSNGDGWKGIPRSNQLFEAASNPVLRAWNQIKGAGLILEFINSADTLILSTEFLFNRWIDAILLRRLMKKAGRTVLLHAGCSDGFHQLNSSELLCQNCKQYDLDGQSCAFDKTFWPGLSSVLTNVDLIIPFTEIYRESAKLFGVPDSHLTSPLHFPIDFDYVNEINCPKQPCRSSVIHGQNRPGFKGTAHLSQMINAQPSLQEYVEFLPRMPFVDFIGRIKNAEIVLDQLFANGYGMTGALALATGTSVAYGYTALRLTPGFEGPGCLPVKIIGEVREDACVLERTLQDYLQHPPSRSEIIDAARSRHDHVAIGKMFLSLIG